MRVSWPTMKLVRLIIEPQLIEGQIAVPEHPDGMRHH